MSDDRETTWFTILREEIEKHGETWDDIVSVNVPHDVLFEPFDAGYGSNNGEPFIPWTTDRVYFPVQYDGAEWVESVPRNPCDEIPGHFGGG